MAARHLTDETVLVGMLHNSRLPTVIVEGKDDHQIYQWVERCAGSQKANVLPVGGKETLLAVYKRRSEFAHLPVAFVADRGSVVVLRDSTGTILILSGRKGIALKMTYTPMLIWKTC